MDKYVINNLHIINWLLFILTGNNNVTISSLEISNPKVIALNAQVETEVQVSELIAA